MDIQEYIQSGIIESYVLGLASEEEAAELLSLSLSHLPVKKALEETELAFEKNALDNASAPDAILKQNLLATLQHEFAPEKAVVASTAAASVQEIPLFTPQPAATRWKYMAAAAAILLVVSASLNYYYYHSYHQASEKYEALLSEKTMLEASVNVYKTRLQEASDARELMANPAMAVVKMPGVAGKENSRATVYWNTQSKEVYLLTAQLPAAPVGKQYQLWAIVDGKPVDAGVLENGNGSLCKMKTIASAQAFAITLEQNGGSPTPTLTALYVMGKV